jgi:hypothetical protein
VLGATRNPMIVLGALKREMGTRNDRIRALMQKRPAATEEAIAGNWFVRSR